MNKALNHLILLLGAAIAGLAFTAIAVILIPSEKIIEQSAVMLLSAIADLFITIYLYWFIRDLFPKQSKVSAITAALATIVLMPLWFGFKLFVTEGGFNLTVAVDHLYLTFIDNLLAKVITPTVTYFSKTLFEENAVLEHMAEYGLHVLDDLIVWVLVPLSPLILMTRDLMRGHEVYRFGNPEESDVKL